MRKYLVLTICVGLLALVAVFTGKSSQAQPATTDNSVIVNAAVVPSADNATAPAPEAAAVTSTEAAPAAAQAKPEMVQPAVMELDMTKEGNVTLDFREADIRNVLKVLAYKSGLNIIAGPEVVGVVNIQLKDVPWEKALDVILSTYGYGYERKGTIIMVSSMENLKKRREDAKLMSDQEPISTETYILNFAKASDVKESLDKMKSPRGSVNFDKRTNSLIVTDVSSNLQLVRDVVKALDTVTPQVLIEAKIIETTLGSTENLGIDWTVQAGTSGSKAQTTLPFDGFHSTNYYPAPALTAAPAFTYGTIDFSAFQAILKMLQTRANTDIISNPRIVTMDNQPAKITVGTQYPVPNYTYNEQQAKLQVTGWNYMDIGVTFNVTPHVNNASMVSVEIETSVTDKTGDATVENTTMPVLSAESAKTSVMIQSGRTLVIAGLITSKVDKNIRKVPILGNIPLLGLLFQSRATDETKRDLLIFLTPHVITPNVEQQAKKN